MRRSTATGRGRGRACVPAALESLEPRTLMSITAGIDSTTITPAEWLIVVHYRSDVPISLSTIGNGDIRATAPARPNPYPQAAFSQVGRLWEQPRVQGDGSVVAVYSIAARGGAWDWADSAHYVVSMEANQVLDNADTAVSAGTLGEYNLWFTTPRAEIALQ